MNQTPEGELCAEPVATGLSAASSPANGFRTSAIVGYSRRHMFLSVGRHQVCFMPALPFVPQRYLA